jgi:hypothetical protein
LYVQVAHSPRIARARYISETAESFELRAALAMPFSYSTVLPSARRSGVARSHWSSGVLFLHRRARHIAE